MLSIKIRLSDVVDSETQLASFAEMLRDSRMPASLLGRTRHGRFEYERHEDGSYELQVSRPRMREEVLLMAE